jgi:signal transduction histidine kinase
MGASPTRKRRRQLELDLGGRKGVGGRPRKPGRRRVEHVRRPRITRHTPVHVTIRMAPHVYQLRSQRCDRVVRRALALARARGTCRFVHYSIQRNHLHLIVEAADRRRLASGMQGFSISLAKGLNRLMQARGRVLDDRYHCQVLETPRQVRHALCYVLQNARRHGAEQGIRFTPRFVDPYSSAHAFDGWTEPIGPSPSGEKPPVSPASAWLLTTGWRRHGRIHPDETPRRG